MVFACMHQQHYGISNDMLKNSEHVDDFTKRLITYIFSKYTFTQLRNRNIYVITGTYR